MGNFDFLKDQLKDKGEFLVNDSTTRDNLLSFLNDENRQKVLYELFNKADIYSKIDIVSSAVFLRQAWDYLCSNIGAVSSNNHSIQYHKLMPKIQLTYRTYVHDTAYRTTDFIGNTGLSQNRFLKDGRNKLLDYTNEYIKSHPDAEGLLPNDENNIFIYQYIRNLGNSGVHLSGETSQTNDYLYGYFNDMTFEMVALGLEFSANILKNFFKGTNNYCYEIDNIPFERFEVLDKEEINDNTNPLIPKRYLLCRHTYKEKTTRNTVRDFNSYVIIKEYEIDKRPEQGHVEETFETMVERRDYIMQYISDSKGSTPVSVISGAKNNTPFRHIAYSVPSIHIPHENIVPKPIFRIDEIFSEEINASIDDSFYKKLVKLACDLSHLLDNDEEKIEVRGFTKENVWVYTIYTNGGIEYFPIFVGYDLCKTPVDGEHSIYTTYEANRKLMSTEVEAIYDLISNGKNNCANPELLASLFILIYNLYRRKFESLNEWNINKISNEFNKDLRKLNEDLLPCATNYLEKMIAKLNAATEDDAGKTMVELGDELENIDKVFGLFEGQDNADLPHMPAVDSTPDDRGSQPPEEQDIITTEGKGSNFTEESTEEAFIQTIESEMISEKKSGLFHKFFSKNR